MTTTKTQVKNSLFRLLLAAMTFGGLILGIILLLVIGLTTPDSYKFLKAGYWTMAGVFLLVAIYHGRKFQLRYKAFKTLIVLD